MHLNLLLAIAVILLGTRLPSYMNRIGMPQADKIAFVILCFLILGAAWYIWRSIGMFI
jgi:hypothetical protein